MSNVRNFGAVGDGITDDTEAILHALHQGDGVLEFPRGVYRITRTLEVSLDQVGRFALDGAAGTATLVMAGPGPALRLLGHHGGTGDPNSVRPLVWEKERMPVVRDIEITGDHPEADGVELIGTMEARLGGVLIRQVRHGVLLHRRNRNVLIHDSHIYHNTGVGILMEDLNLHQINICGNHISYNRLGGIRLERSEVRNLQITGNDIEYNNHRAFGAEPEVTAEILIDTTAEGASVNEVTIASNTIQATPSPGGCNVRILEKPDKTSRPPGLINITGNVIGNQEYGVHLTGCYGVTVSGNTIYSASERNVLVQESSHVNLSGNVFRRHTPTLHTGVRLEKSSDCILSGCSFRDESEEGQASGASLLEMEGCRRITVQGCQFIDASPWGLHAEICSQVLVTGCLFGGDLLLRRGIGAIRFVGEGVGNRISACLVDGAVDLDPVSGVRYEA